MASQGGFKSRFALTGKQKEEFNQQFQEAEALLPELERAERAGLPVSEVKEAHKQNLARFKAFKAQYVD